MGRNRGLYFYTLKNILTILSSSSSSFSSRRFNMTIYFSLKVDLYWTCQMFTYSKTLMIKQNITIDDALSKMINVSFFFLYNANNGLERAIAISISSINMLSLPFLFEYIKLQRTIFSFQLQGSYSIAGLNEKWIVNYIFVK